MERSVGKVMNESWESQGLMIWECVTEIQVGLCMEVHQKQLQREEAAEPGLHPTKFTDNPRFYI